MQKNRSFLTKSEKVDAPVGYCKTPSFHYLQFCVSLFSLFRAFQTSKIKAFDIDGNYQIKITVSVTLSLHQFINLMRKIK